MLDLLIILTASLAVWVWHLRDKLKLSTKERDRLASALEAAKTEDASCSS